VCGTGRDCGRADAEHAGGGISVELEHDAESHDLALAGAQRGERGLELRRETLDECLLHAVGRRGRLLAPAAARLGAEPVERGRPRDTEEPRARAAATRVEAPPQTQCLLEGRAREVLGGFAVASEVEEVPEHVVELRLGGLGEAAWRLDGERLLERHRVHIVSTPLVGAGVTGRRAWV
jgi:hypothetical protein